MQIRRFMLRDQSEIMVTRKLGEQIRQRILSQLQRSSEPESLLLDFAGLKILDYSCADELVARLAVELQNHLHGERFLLLAGLDETLQENVGVALKQRDLGLLFWHQGEWDIIGELRSHLCSALELIIKRGALTARELADAEELAINTASNRLFELAKLGLAFRTGATGVGGKQFLYRSILPDEPDE